MAQDEKKEKLTESDKVALEKLHALVVRMMFIVDGFCPNCFQFVRGWTEPRSPEVKTQIQANGINAKTGHRTSCVHEVV